MDKTSAQQAAQALNGLLLEIPQGLRGMYNKRLIERPSIEICFGPARDHCYDPLEDEAPSGLEPGWYAVVRLGPHG